MIQINKIFSLLFLILAINLSAQTLTFYIDPNTGNDSNSGTIDQPFKTISKGLSALTSSGILYLRNGIYLSPSKLSLSKTGQSNNYFKIWAYPGERPMVDFTGNGSSDGFSVSGSYYHLKGLEIKKAGHNGINISGHYNIVENCAVHDNGNTGIHMGSQSSLANPSNNLILNCDSYYNFDPPLGGNADGFSAKWNIGVGNIFRDCRAWNNSDDGWDLWMGISSVIIDSCFAFRNGVDIWHTGLNGNNGNGFKVGGNYIATPHIVKNCVSFDNAGDTGRGFDENNNTAGQTIFNCVAFRNKGDNYHFVNVVVQGNHNLANCISLQGMVNISSGTQTKNSWQGFTVTNSDFISVDTSGVTSSRDANGRLKPSNFFRLNVGSPLINAGVDVGISFLGSAPDLGAFEFNPATPVEIKSDETLPNEFSLYQNYPNPFNPETTIQYMIPSAGNVEIKIYDINARLVKELYNDISEAGIHIVSWNGMNQTSSRVASGNYFCVVRFNGLTKSLKLVLLK